MIGNYTYSGCAINEKTSCTLTEEGGPAAIAILKEGHETAKVTFEYEVNVQCPGFISCTYNGEGLKGTAKGPSLSEQTNGSVEISEQLMHNVFGFFCSKKVKLDLTTTPSEAAYITS
jgi:hypothetical protein